MSTSIVQCVVTLLSFLTVLAAIPVFGVQEDQGSETVETAARKAYDQGEAELAKNNHTGAITLLKTAVRIQPENAKYQHKLAKAFLAAQQYHDMWVHLRKATVLELANQEYSDDFLRMWKYHDLEGMFNIGTSSETVLKMLGEPDKRIENAQMKRWVYGFMAIDYGQGGVFRTIDLRGYNAESAAEVEQVSVNTDPSKWQVAHHQVSKTNDNLELTIKGEKIQQWSELFSKQRFPMMSRSAATVKGMVGSIHESLKNADPNVEFTIVSESPTAITYHWVTTTTKENPAQHEVAKIMKGKKDFYRVAYVKKTDRLDQPELDKWLKIIGDAELVPFKNSAKTNQVSQAPKTSGNTKQQAWELGKSLSFAALIRGKHGPEEVVKRSLMSVSKNAQALKVQVPHPDKLTDDANADTAAAIQFLLVKAGKPIHNSLQQKYGDEQAALFELATKSTLLSMLYQSGDSTGQSIASAIQRAATKAGLEKSTCTPLVELVSNKSPQKDVVAEVQNFQKRVADAIGR